MSSWSNRVILTVGLVVIGVGLLDSVISQEWDLLAVFILIGLIHLTLWMRESAPRRPYTLRPDLARWIDRRSALVGEPPSIVLDRSVAHYKHGLYVASEPDE